jgi:putative aminopeptidase FrvX
VSEAPKLLDDLLGAAGPSGYEGPASDVWREAASFAELSTDALGSSVARIGEKGARPLIAVVGHIDEIGLVITHVDSNGFLYFAPIGGWDPQILLGQRIEVQGKNGKVTGVVGRKPIHLLKEDQRKSVVELRDMHIDIGAKDEKEALERVRVGDPVVIAADPVELDTGRLVSRSLDDRIGAYVALEALRRVHERGGLRGQMAAVAAVQEEIGSHGARTTAYSLEPDLAIAIDVTHATDAPGVHAVARDLRATRGDRRAPGDPAHDRGIGVANVNRRRHDPDRRRRSPRGAGVDSPALHALARRAGRPRRRRRRGRVGGRLRACARAGARPHPLGPLSRRPGAPW